MHFVGEAHALHRECCCRNAAALRDWRDTVIFEVACESGCGEVCRASSIRALFKRSTGPLKVSAMHLALLLLLSLLSQCPAACCAAICRCFVLRSAHSPQARWPGRDSEAVDVQPLTNGMAKCLSRCEFCGQACRVVAYHLTAYRRVKCSSLCCEGNGW